jgi:hypothetical protein
MIHFYEPAHEFSSRRSARHMTITTEHELRDTQYKLYKFICTIRFQVAEYCTMLQVILTPTCRVSGYPRQVIEIDAA